VHDNIYARYVCCHMGNETLESLLTRSSMEIP